MAIYLLAMYPKFLTRLREEIISKVGPTRRPTYEEIKEMKFLRAVLNGAVLSFLVARRELLTGSRNAAPFPRRVSD